MERSPESQNNQKDLYDKWKTLAQSIKIRCQMIVGALTVIAIIVTVLIRFAKLVRGDGTVGEMTAEVFAVTAVGLAVAAALELAYALYTPGPDEALDPLILGVSSTFLFLASQSTKLDWQFGVAAALLAVALYGLFTVKERFRNILTDGKDESEPAPGGGTNPDSEVRQAAGRQP
jgi:hypothetical protein